MGNIKKLIYVLAGLCVLLGLVLVAGCSHQATTATSSTEPPPLESASATVQPYTVVDQLPSAPAANEHRSRTLHLVHHDGQLCLADTAGHYYDCGRDAHGNLYPCFYDRYTRQYCPLYYDSERDNYYCAVWRDGRYYREYWDSPNVLYYDDQVDYADYYPPAEDRPVIYVESTYYHPSYYSHHAHPDWLAALPVVAVAFIALSDHGGHGYHGRNGYVASNPPIYRNGRGGAPYHGAPAYNGGGPGGFGRPAPAGRVANAPAQSRPFGYQAGRAPHPAARPIPGRPAGQIAGRPGAPGAPHAAPGRPFYAHHQAARAPSQLHPVPLGARQAQRPAARPARPAARAVARRVARPAPRAIARAPRPAQRAVARAPRPAQRAIARAPRPAQRAIARAPRPAPRPMVRAARPMRSPMPPHPATRTVARPFRPATRPSPPAYHRTFAPQGQRPAPQAARGGGQGFGRPQAQPRAAGRPQGRPQAQPRAAGRPQQGVGPRRRPGGQ